MSSVAVGLFRVSAEDFSGDVQGSDLHPGLAHSCHRCGDFSDFMYILIPLTGIYNGYKPFTL